MFSYDEETGKIQLTRGDTAYIEVYAEDGKGNLFEFSKRTDIRMSVREDYESELLFQIQAKDGVIKILPEHTSGMEPGPYRYDVQVTLENGDVVTYGPYKFKLAQEVTYG